MKQLQILVFLLIPVLAKTQSICGFFLQEFYYVNPIILIENKVDKIVFVGKMKGSGKLLKEVYLDSNGKKIKQFYSTADTSYSEEFKNAELCDMVCRKAFDTSKMICNKAGFIETLKLPGSFRQIEYDSLYRPTNETWNPNRNFKIKRQFVYTADNLIDTINVQNYQNENLIGQECYCYKYSDNRTQLISIEHYLKLNNRYVSAGSFSYEYNKAGLIDLSKGKDDFGNFTLTVKYYSNDKAIR